MLQVNASGKGEISKRRARILDIVHRFTQNKLAMLGLVVLILLIFMALTANWIADYDEVVINQVTSRRLEAPSGDHIFGTDEYGRDLASRVMHGARTSLVIGFASAFVSVLIGGIVGAVAGFYGGKVDNVIMRFTDILIAIPFMLLAIAIISALGAGTRNLIMALAIAHTPAYTRLFRVSVLSIRSQEYVEAARSIGCTDGIIIAKHIIPNTIGPLIVQFTLGIAQSILEACSLSYIGLGVQPPTPEWGSMLSEGANLIRNAPHLILFPGIAIFLTVLAVNLLGDGLRDALDPRLKK